MVLLVEKFAKLYTKLENRHHHDDLPKPEKLSSSLHAFKSHVSKFIAQLALDLKPGSSETLSLSWIGRFFGFLPMINKAFAELVVDIDYPMSKWEVDSIEGYLNYTLSLLELLNSMSSSLSHLGHARLSLAHGLSLLENSPSLARKHLKSIQPACFRTDFGKEFYKEDDRTKIFSGKEGVVHEALKEMKSIGLWVCGVLLSGLYSDGKAYMELRKIAGGFDISPVFTLDLKISEQLVEKMPIFSEVKQLNIAVDDLVVASDEKRHDAAMEVQTKLRDFETILDDISKEVDDLFANVMAQRSELIDCFRLKKQAQKSIV